MVSRTSLILKSESGKIIISIILGIGLSTLFQRVCHGKNCVIVKAPPTSKIVNKTFKQDNKCYQYVPESTKCMGNEIE